eukprot:6216329-Prymnesium_polylepis.1
MAELEAQLRKLLAEQRATFEDDVKSKTEELRAAREERTEEVHSTGACGGGCGSLCTHVRVCTRSPVRHALSIITPFLDYESFLQLIPTTLIPALLFPTRSTPSATTLIPALLFPTRSTPSAYSLQVRRTKEELERRAVELEASLERLTRDAATEKETVVSELKTSHQEVRDPQPSLSTPTKEEIALLGALNRT